MKNENKKVGFVFFGSSRFSCFVLDELLAAGFLPSLIVTTPDKPKDRKLVVSPSIVKVWAEAHGTPVLTPEKLQDGEFQKKLQEAGADFFIVASYGKIIPKTILEMTESGALNVHPSLLPHLRGPTPIQTAILKEEKTGVTIMLVDEKVDHGPIVAKEEVVAKEETASEKKVATENRPPYASELEEKLARAGGKLLARTIPDWLEGKIKAVPQNDSEATFTKKISKEDGLIDLSGDPTENLRKIRAYNIWPVAYFFAEQSGKKNGKKIRVLIKKAEIAGDGKLKITKVVPEGKKEMPYEDFLRGAK